MYLMMSPLTIPSLDAMTLEDKPIKSLDLVKTENGERPIPARPAASPPVATDDSPVATNGGSTNGNGAEANGNGTKNGLEHRGGDSATILEEPVPSKRPRADTTADSEEQDPKRTKLGSKNETILIEDDDGAIILD